MQYRVNTQLCLPFLEVILSTETVIIYQILVRLFVPQTFKRLHESV